MLKSNFCRLVVILFSVPNALMSGQTANSSDDDFPLRVTIDSVSEVDPLAGMDSERKALASAEGMEVPYFVFFQGKIDGEDHWDFSCRRENRLRESIPCTTIPLGVYSGRWIHDHRTLEIIGGSIDEPMTRFLSVTESKKDPPSSDNPILQIAPFDFPVRFPKGKGASDYPVFAHVYGGFSIDLPVGRLPEHTRCDAYAWSNSRASVNCADYPSVEITRGYVGLDISAGKVEFASLRCEAKWRWSHCSLLDPGLYYGRTDKDRLILLTHDVNGRPVEVGFEVQMDQKRVASPVK